MVESGKVAENGKTDGSCREYVNGGERAMGEKRADFDEA